MIRKTWRHKSLKDSILGALDGVRIVLKSEKNARIIFTIGVITLILATLLKVDGADLAILIVVVIAVFVCETFNTLVEVILDMIKPHHDPHVKILKDVASGAVLIACLGAIAVGTIIFLPKILSLLSIPIKF